MAMNQGKKSPKEKLSDAAELGHNRQVTGKLCRFLASTATIYQKTLYYHWNVTGANFMGVHTLLEQHYTELATANDEIAERIRALGEIAPGTMTEFLQLTSLREDKRLPASGMDMVANLVTDHESCTAQAKELFDAAEDHDPVTADMMVTRMRFHDKAAWMLRSVLSR